MHRKIEEHDLLPLKKDIVKINGFTAYSPLYYPYLDFLEKEKIEFSFRQHEHSLGKVFNTESKEAFITYIQSKSFGFFAFQDKETKQIAAELFLESFIGKDFSQLETLFQHIDVSVEVSDFYKSLGLIALSSGEKNFFKELTNPFNSKDKNYTVGLILHAGNAPYLIKHHDFLFKDMDKDFLLTNWIKKVNHYENNNKRPSFSSNERLPVSVHHQLGRKARAFTLKLAGMIVLKQDYSMIEQLFVEYDEALSQKIVSDFFKTNKSSFIRPAFHLYKQYIDNYKNSTIDIEEIDLMQKKLTVDITGIMQKHLLNYEVTSKCLTSIFDFFKQQPDFEHSTISFNETTKQCSFSLISVNDHYLKNGKTFLSKVLNDKEIFMYSDKFQSVFLYTHLDNKFEVKNIKSEKKKI